MKQTVYLDAVMERKVRSRKRETAKEVINDILTFIAVGSMIFSVIVFMFCQI